MLARTAHGGGGRTLLEVGLALATGVAAFAATALLGTAARSHVPEPLFGGLLIVGVAVVARSAGILFALPVGVAAVLAFDWYVLPPLRALDGNTVLVLGTFLVMAVVVGEGATRTGRRMTVSERARGALATEQTALRHVATLIARTTPPTEVFAVVVTEVGQLLQVDFTVLLRYGPDRTATLVGTWTKTGTAPPTPAGSRLELGGRNVASQVLATKRPARMDDYAGVSGALGELGRGWGFRSAVGVPVDVEGRLWGVMIVAYTHEEPLPADTEGRLAGFTELVATAIANAQAREELRGFAEEQAALRRVATLVAMGAPPEELFAAVTAEVGQLLSVELALLNRFDVDGAATVAGAWARSGPPLPLPVGSRWTSGGDNVTTRVFREGGPARTDDYADATGPAADLARDRGFRSIVGAPIKVAGRLWGFMSVLSTHQDPLPADTEARLVGFTELVATALANAEAQAALSGSRARIVAAADNTRRRIERDLHDGAQQRLVSLALHLRGSVRSAVPAGGEALAAQLDEVATDLTGVLDDLREIARGLHPAALASGGLRPALKTLARRSAVPVRLDVGLQGRLPEQVELAAYYVIAEALTNAAKHAAASVVDVEVTADDRALRVCVHDDGHGGAQPSGGSGLVGLTDRIDALGGRLALSSPLGAGTTLEVTLPLAPSDRPEMRDEGG